jgi:AraC-like DNA-binding protein
MSYNLKRRDGFEGEKLISLPERVWKDAVARDPGLFKIYITHIGYFPKAAFHYRERRKGCQDNILIYCLHGKGYYIFDDKRYTVTTNQFVVLPATDKYMRYWADNDDPWSIYWVHFTGAELEKFNQSLNFSAVKGPIPIPFNEKAIEIWTNIYHSLEQGYSTENLCNASFCLYHLIATFIFPDKHIISEEPDSKDIITETIRYMKGNLESKLTVKDMAFQHQFSASHFSSIFKKKTGMPPIDYFINLKMQRACQLLFANKIKIKQIAMDLGYDDPYYFSRLFKRYMGSSPEQYRLTTQHQN